MALPDNCTLNQTDRCLQDFVTSIIYDTESGPNHDALKPLISDNIIHTLELIINVIGLYATSIFGVAANIINLVVYGKQGLKESITVGFFALSLMDLILVSMPLITASCHAADFLIPNAVIDFPSIHYVSSGWLRNMMYSMSCFITAFLSLERCCCIILPFKVRVLFTRGKSAFIIIAAFVVHLACILMLPAAFELRWMPGYNVSITRNITRILRVSFFEKGAIIEVLNTTMMSLIIPATTQVIVTICAVIMVNGLRISAKFRIEATRAGRSKVERQTTVTNDFSTAISESEIRCSGVSEDKNGDLSKREKTINTNNSNQLTNRDARLVKTMVFLVSILSACNVPFLVATFAWRAIPEMNMGMAYENTLRVAFSFVYLLGNINASSNVFVYYHTSSNFRQVFNKICGRGEKKK